MLTHRIATTAADFRIDEQMVAVPRSVLAAIADQLAQYQQYGEDMRAIGRGMYPSSPFGQETTVCIVNALLIEARNRKGVDCLICGESTLNNQSRISLADGHTVHVACREGSR